MGGRSIGSTLGRWLEKNAPGLKWPLVALIVLGLVGYIAWTVRKEKREKERLTGSGFRALTLSGESRTLHLVAPGAAAPTNVAGQLRSFETAAEAYRYVFVQFGEALYDRIVVHQPGAEKDAAEFARDSSLTDEQNTARLSSLMHPAVPDAATA